MARVSVMLLAQGLVAPARVEEYGFERVVGGLGLTYLLLYRNGGMLTHDVDDSLLGLIGRVE